MPESFFQNLIAANCLPDPLIVQLQRFLTSLIEQGYADETVRWKVKRIADFGQWLKQKGVAVADLGEALVEAFLKRQHRDRRGDLRTLQQFLDQLRRQHVVPARNLPCDRSPLAHILNQYETHLRTERGLVAHTIEQYQSFVRKFLGERFRGQPLLLKAVKACDISDFVLRHTPRMNVKRAQVMTTAFRSFFRFLFQKGEIGTDLAASVPSVPDWRQATVPKYLTPEEVQRVLGACNRRTASGRRDYVILIMLARLGLRAGEVVSLQLDDIDWRAGEILIRGKGLRHDRMPLPNDVGNALASYLRRDRPACQSRRVFVRMKAPHRGFAACGTLPTIVRSAIERANLHPPSKGAHILRHSLATAMLRSGATMGEIGEVLRHRNLGTTEIYAKVDFNGLRSLAHPWPAGGEQ